MEIDGIRMLSKEIITSENLGKELLELFNSPEANVNGVVYFFMSKLPIPRVIGESRILYIGRTQQTIKRRYSKYSQTLASNRSGEFYKRIIENYGGITMGYVVSSTPVQTEREYFLKYRDTFYEHPPKSKVGKQ